MKYSLLSKYRSELMGVAILSVMLFHAYDLNLGLDFLNRMRALGFGGVDIFVLLSGLGLAVSLARRQQEYGQFMGRRLRRILPAYFMVMLPYTACLFYVKRATLSAFIWNSFLLNYWIRPQGGFNWYVTGIILLYAVTPQLHALLTPKRHRLPVLLAIVAAALLACQIFMRDGYWFHLDILYRVPIFAIGLVIGLWVCEDRPVKLPDAVVWVALLAAGIWYAWVFPGLGTYAPLAHLFLMTTVPACLILTFLMDKLPVKPIHAALRFLGENSLEIYLLNVSFFAELDFLRRFFDPDSGHYLYYAAAFALNILLGWVLHQVIAFLEKILAKKSS